MLRLSSYLYYFLKPVVPEWLRLSLRRVRSRRRLRQYAKVWPIDERAGAKPPHWPGWPRGCQFAVVLTHDVEGAVGVQKVPEVLQLERELGFRSSFNLVPADPSVTSEVREAILSGGAEVGVHGWKHDGKLYFTRAGFLKQASAINKVLQQWGAVGFRSPFMHRNLNWLHELELEYDSSTFDTDPFEPEPDGVQTIFPYWVGRGGGAGYVELPYTMVQDYTLFKVIGEDTAEVWKQKLEWIAAKGGMVLLNTHPDYMSFDETKADNEYPVARYREFLLYLKEKYEGRYWAALPKDVCTYYKEVVPLASRNSRRRVCMVTYSNYESDNRVRRYAESLTSRGDQVLVIAIETGDGSVGARMVAHNVELVTLQRRVHNEASHWTYAYRLCRFLVVSSWYLRNRHSESRFDLVHVHNIPDFMVFSAWYPKLCGASVILDIHDIVPELFESKFRTPLSAFYVRALKVIEKVSARFADHVIIANHLWYDRITARSVEPSRCTAFVNNVDRSLFYQRARTRQAGPPVILFHGTFQWHQGIEIAVKALVTVRRQVPEAELHLYGGGAGGKRTRIAIEELAERLGVGSHVRVFDSVPIEEIPVIVANADVGIVPKRADSFGNEAYSTKIMEFMSQSVPVVVSRTKVDTFYFDEETVCFFDSGDAGDMARAIIEVLSDPEFRMKKVQKGLEYVEKHSWDSVRSEYYQLVDGLQSRRVEHDQ